MSETNSRILLLAGSVRRESRTLVLCRYLQELLQTEGVITELWSAGLCPLPIADPAFHLDPGSHPDSAVKWLVSACENADGLVWATPLYHNGYSGVLKNALDHLAIRQMSYKPVLLVGHGGSRSTQAVDTLRTIVRGFLAIPCPTAVCTAGSDFGGDTIALTDAAIQMRCLRGAKELIQMSRALLPYRSLLREIASQG